MHQLFLAALKTVWEGHKGRCFSRYGPAREKRVGCPASIERFLSESQKTTAQPPSHLSAVIAKTATSHPTSFLIIAIAFIGRISTAGIGRESVPHPPAFMRTLNVNALAATSLPEGAF